MTLCLICYVTHLLDTPQLTYALFIFSGSTDIWLTETSVDLCGTYLEGKREKLFRLVLF